MKEEKKNIQRTLKNIYVNTKQICIINIYMYQKDTTYKKYYIYIYLKYIYISSSNNWEIIIFHYTVKVA